MAYHWGHTTARNDSSHDPDAPIVINAPKECIYCFAAKPKTDWDFDGWSCLCEVCGRTWHEKTMIPSQDGRRL